MNRTSRFLFLIAAVLALLAVSVGSAAATSVADLTALAEYAPVESPVFFAVRTDEDFVTTLDQLASRLAAAFPEDFPADFSVRSLLNDPSLTPLGGVDTAVRPWLGDSAAAFVSTSSIMALTGVLEVQFVFSVTDREAALTFLSTAYEAELTSGALVQVDDDAITRYETSTGDVPVALTENAIVVSSSAPFSGDINAAVLPGEDAPSLADASAFDTALAALPATDYNALVYTDLGDLLAQALPLVSMQIGTEASLALGLDTLAERFGQQAIGFTLLEDRTLAMDVASVGSLFADFADAAPISPDFARRIPAEMALVIFGTDLGGQIRMVLDAIATLSPIFQQTNEDVVVFGADLLTLNTLLTALRLNYQGVVGQPLDEALANASGDFALALGFGTLGEGSEAALTLRPAFVMQTANAGDSLPLVEALARQVTQTLPRATYADGLLTLPGDILFQESDALPPLLDGQLASQGDLLAAGDVESVQFALNPEGDGLAGSESYAFERGLFVPSAQTAWLINFAALRELISLLESIPMTAETLGSPEEVADLKALLALFDTAAISAAVDGDGTLRARFTVTLAQ